MFYCWTSKILKTAQPSRHVIAIFCYSLQVMSERQNCLGIRANKSVKWKIIWCAVHIIGRPPSIPRTNTNSHAKLPQNGMKVACDSIMVYWIFNAKQWIDIKCSAANMRLFESIYIHTHEDAAQHITLQYRSCNFCRSPYRTAQLMCPIIVINSCMWLCLKIQFLCNCMQFMRARENNNKYVINRRDSFAI